MRDVEGRGLQYRLGMYVTILVACTLNETERDLEHLRLYNTTISLNCLSDGPVLSALADPLWLLWRVLLHRGNRPEAMARWTPQIWAFSSSSRARG